MKLRILYLLFLLIGISVYLRAGNSESNAIVIDTNGNILVGGLANNLTNETTDFSFARYLPNGFLDPTFNPTALIPGRLQIDIRENVPQVDAVILTPTDEGVTDIALAADNKIVAVGFASVGLNSSIAVLRLNPNGSLDTTFNPNGLLGTTPGFAVISIGEFVDTATAVAIDSQGRIVVVGTTDNGQNLDLIVLRLTTAGILDTTFNAQSATPGIFVLPGGENDVLASDVLISTSDSIIVGGTRNTGLNTDFLILKLTSAGVVDTTFNAQSTTPGFVQQDFQGDDDVAFSLAVDQMQRIVIAGTTSNGLQTDFALARYNANGTLDTTFNPAGLQQGAPGTVITSITENDDVIRAVAIDTAGNIVVTGFSDNQLDRSFTTARYTQAGTLDETFNPGGIRPGVVITSIGPATAIVSDVAINTDNEAHALVIGPENQIFISGYSNDGLQRNFTTINYLATGMLDTTFNTLGAVSLRPGVVVTLFGESLTSLGNGAPLIVEEDVSGVSPDILERLRYPLEPIAPIITSELSRIPGGVQQAVAGYASPNSVVSVYVDDVEAATAIADASGAWQVTLPGLVDGTYEVSAVSLDPLSGITLASLPRLLAVNTELPPAPIIEGPIMQERLATLRPVITGRAEPGTMVSVYVDDEQQGTSEVDQEGRWRVEVSGISEGEHILTAQARAQDGIESVLSNPVGIIIDMSGEQAPRITVPKSGLTSDRNELLIQGEGAPNSTVKLFANNEEIATVPISDKGIWAHTLRDLVGDYEVYATTPNQNFTSESVRFSVVPGTPEPAPERIERSVSGLIEGTSEPDSRVTFYADNKYLGATTTDTAGSWAYTPIDTTLKGEHQVKVIVSDAAGDPLSVVEKVVNF